MSYKNTKLPSKDISRRARWTQTDSLVRTMMSSTAARLLTVSRQQILLLLLPMLWIQTGCQPFGKLNTPTRRASITWPSNRICGTPTHPTNHPQQQQQPSPPLAIKSAFLFLHFTAMPIVNPAHLRKAPPTLCFSLFSKCAAKPLISL